MKKLKGAWAEFGKISFIIGVGLFFLSIIFYFLYYSMFLPCLVNSIGWLAIGVSLIAITQIFENNLKRLKKSGKCIEAVVENIVPTRLIRVGNYVTAFVRCSFVNDEGIRVWAKSEYCLFSPSDGKNTITAVVHAGDLGFDEYAVEVFRK
ncbi:MAG: hypothetical protein FWG90_10255 [Oscillospiraceae bacterium]|nr:hypothetical protein [Oscillospiraceae bacterium]